MILLITGGREFVPQPVDEAALVWLLDWLRPEYVLHGGARGADRWGGRIAARLGVAVRSQPADWETYGRRAGLIRNEQMLDEVGALRRAGAEARASRDRFEAVVGLAVLGVVRRPETGKVDRAVASE